MKDLRTVLEAISIEISQSKKVRCNECPFNNINNLKKWMDKYIKEKIESNK